MPQTTDLHRPAIHETVSAILALPVGMILGSFATVVAHRVPRGESWIGGRSRCPTCGATIAPYDNIPVVSWLLLRGRCRSCRERISARYPLTELSLAGAFILGFLVRPMAIIGMLFVAHLWLGLYRHPGEWPWNYVFLAMVHVLFVVYAAGRSLGVDALLRRRVGLSLLGRVAARLA